MKTLSFLFLLAMASIAQPRTDSIYQPYTVTTAFGWGGGGSQDGTGIEARFNYPQGGAFDRAGNLYVSDTSNDTIRKITPDGVVTTFAGMAGEEGSADGQGSAARFKAPGEIAIDAASNVYVADIENNTIRKITPNAVVTTIAGTPGVFGHVDGPGPEALFNYPYGMVIDRAGNLFISEVGNQVIRKITPDDIVSTFAGGGCCDEDGTGTEAGFVQIGGLGIDQNDNIFAAEYSTEQVREITPAAVVTHYNRSAIVLTSDVAVDRQGHVLATDGDFICYVPPTGIRVLYAGTLPGSEDAVRLKAHFENIAGLVFGPSGDLYAIDAWNHNIRRIPNRGSTSTVAGLAPEGSRDAAGTEARFNGPVGIVSDGAGGFYVCDTINDTIRKIDSAGAVTTIAGKVLRAGLVDGKGDHARFNQPVAIARDASGNLYIADSLNNAVRKLDSAGNVTTAAVVSGNTAGIAVDATGNIYVSVLNEIDKVTPDGQVSIFADHLNAPHGLVFDSVGNLIVANSGDSTIRQVSAAGVVTTIAGTGKNGAKDGPVSIATFHTPHAVAVDSAGDIFVTDSDNSLLRKISGGQVTTLAGAQLNWGWKDGTGADAELTFPKAIIVDTTGALYFCDFHTIRKAVPAQ